MTVFTLDDLRRMGYTVTDGVARRVDGVPVSTRQDEPNDSDAPRFRSKWEAERATYWEAAKRAGTVREWRYEPLRLRLADGAWYKPDFLVEWGSRALMLEEVKGHWREAALVRFKVARELYPMFSFRAITKRDGAWADAMEGRR